MSCCPIRHLRWLSILFIAGYSAGSAVFAQQPEALKANDGSIVLFRLGKLSDVESMREHVKMQGDAEVKNFGLDAKHVETLLEELREYEIIAIDMTKKRTADGRQLIEFTNGKAPQITLLRTTGEYISDKFDPSVDPQTPQISASVVIKGPMVASKTSKEIVVQLEVYGLRGPNWRAKGEGYRWTLTTPKTIKLSTDSLIENTILANFKNK